MNISFLDLSPMHDHIAGELQGAFNKVLKKNWYVLGNELEQFEKDYAEFNEVKFSVGVSNGLDALHLSLRALGIGAGDEVIVPSNTYIATVLAISYVGATPIFVEPDIRTYNIDPGKIEEKISARTRAIMPVHLYGQACEMEKISDIARRSGLYVVEDNAQSHGAAFNGKLTGSWGDINGTSFYPGKNLGALGDAGGVTTNDAELQKKVRTFRNYGSAQKYYNDVIGYNMRLDEVQAALLSVKLKYLKDWTSQRQIIASWYDKALAGIGDVILPAIAGGATHVYHLYVIRTRQRDLLQQRLSENGVGTLIHYPVPPHLQKAYAHLGYKEGSFPLAEEISNTCLSLPVWSGMKQEQVEFIRSIFLNFYQ